MHHTNMHMVLLIGLYIFGYRCYHMFNNGRLNFSRHLFPRRVPDIRFRNVTVRTQGILAMCLG